jgi:hypothetical protein
VARDLAQWLATYRAVRLLQRDEVWPLPELRAKLQGNDAFMATRWSALLDCPWCLSIWLAGGLVLLRMISPRVHDALVAILAASAVTGLLSEVTDRWESEPGG